MFDNWKMPSDDQLVQEYNVEIVKKGNLDWFPTLDFYRIVSIKKRFWSFFKASDIRPCLSTILKFMESVLPFIKSKVKGILISMPAKTDIKKYYRLLNFGLKKSYLRIFDAVQAQHSPDSKINQFNNYLFLAKKGSNPNQLFKTSMFKKNYTFGYLDTEFLDTVAPKMFQKDTVSLKVDKKYAFGKLDINLLATVDGVETDDEIPDVKKFTQSKIYSTDELLKVTDVKKVEVSELGGIETKQEKLAKLEAKRQELLNKLEAHKENAMEKVKEVLAAEPKVEFLTVKEAKEQGVSMTSDGEGYLNAKTILFPFVICIGNLEMLKYILIDGGYSTLGIINRLQDEFRYLTSNERKILIAGGAFTLKSGWEFSLTETEEAISVLREMIKSGELLSKHVQNLKDAAYSFGSLFSDYHLTGDPSSVKSDYVYEIESEISQINNDIYEVKYSSDSFVPYEKAVIEIPIKLESVVPGFEDVTSYDPENVFKHGKLGFETDKENVEKKKDSVRAMESVRNWMKSVPDSKYGEDGFSKLYSYTGSMYDSYNDVFKSIVSGQNKPSDTYGMGEHIKTLIDYFVNEAPTLDKGIWVYRNGRIGDQDKIEAGKFFTNATIMSTSVSSKMSMGSYKMRPLIYLPAGTRCFPMFDFSSHPGESEIVLAPMSTFKMVEVYKFKDHSKSHAIKSVYVGSAIESLKEMIDKDEKLDIGASAVFEMEKYIENARKLYEMKDKKDKKEEKTKWGDLSSMAFSDKVQKAIKDKKLKLSMDFGKKQKK